MGILERISSFKNIIKGIFTIVIDIVYPKIIRESGAVTKAIFYFIALGTLGSSLVYGYMYAMEKIWWIVLGFVVIVLVIAIFKYTGFWSWITTPARRINSFFFGSTLRKVIWIPTLIILLILARALWHNPASTAVLNIANPIILANFVLAIALFFTRYKKTALVNALIVIIAITFGWVDKLSSFGRSQDVNRIVITDKPISSGKYSIPTSIVDYKLGKTSHGENEYITDSDLVLDKTNNNEVVYTSGIVTDFWGTSFVNTYLYNVNGLAVIKARPESLQDVDILRDVNFDVEDRLWFGHNVRTAIIKRLGPIDFSLVKPGNVLRLQDKDGKWYIIVHVDRLTNVLFPYHQPYGVYLIEESLKTNAIESMLLGEGKFIPINEIKKYSFLDGQILTSDRSVIELGHSALFRGGFINGMTTNTRSLYIDSENGKPIISKIYVKEINGETINGFMASLQMITKKKIVMETWYIPLTGNVNTVYVYENQKNGDQVTADSELDKTLRSNYDSKNINNDNYKTIATRPINIKVDGKIIEYRLSAISAIDKDGGIADQYPIMVLHKKGEIVKDFKKLPISDHLKSLITF